MSGSLARPTCLVLFASCLAFCSCGTGKLPTYPVSGKIFFEDKPTPRAAVFLHPLDEVNKSASVHPSGLVQDDGSFQISTWKRNDGAPVGRYAVTVVWQGPSQVGDRGGPNLLPERYSNPGASGLFIEVKETTNALPPFRLVQ
jgi:hypothetical protein